MPETPNSKELSQPETRILNAAHELFLFEGYSNVTTEKLARKAEVSKSSIYKYFSNMKGVLMEVVRQEGEMLKVGVDLSPETKEDFWRSLAAYGTNLLTLLNKKKCIQLDKMLHEEARRYPDLSRLFYEATYHQGQLTVAELIKVGKQKGFITKPQKTEHLADNLISIWEGLSYVRARLGLTDKPYPNPKKWAQQCLETLFGDDLKA